MIQARNIDLSSLGTSFITASLASDTTVTTSQKTLLSITIPESGTYLVLLSGYASGATADGYVRPYIYTNNTQSFSVAIDITSSSGVTRRNISTTYANTFSSGDVISLRMLADSGTYSVRNGTRLSALRVFS